jgi:hypothetical protein
MADFEYTPTRVVFGRLFWMFVGPMMLMLATIHIVFNGTGWLTPVDGFYFAVLGGLILGRWLEFGGGKPLTGTGEPATWHDFRRYSCGVAILGIAVWVLANALGNQGIR